jgi:hypothetical protein
MPMMRSRETLRDQHGVDHNWPGSAIIFSLAKLGPEAAANGSALLHGSQIAI